MIIIKTPQPDTEERLVLVPPESCTPVFDDGKQTGLSVRAQGARDATPADLERGGYVAAHRDELSSMTTRVATLAAALETERDLTEKQRARAEKAEGLLIQRETELRLAREDGDESARGLRQAYERAVAAAEKAEREIATERYKHGSTLTSRDMIHNKLAQAEREQNEAIRRGIECIGAGPTNIENVVARLVNIVEASRGIEKDYAARLKAAETELARLMQERDTLRAEVAEASKALLEAGCVDVPATLARLLGEVSR